jgi:hypothetical protein
MIMTTQQQNKLQPKKPYQQPKLTTFGDLRTLTQAGTALQNEGPGQGAQVKRP